MYHDRFPELSGMVPEPIVYLKTVNILMNDIDKGWTCFLTFLNLF